MKATHPIGAPVTEPVSGTLASQIKRPAVIAVSVCCALLLSASIVFGVPLFAGEYLSDTTALTAPFIVLAAVLSIAYPLVAFGLNALRKHVNAQSAEARSSLNTWAHLAAPAMLFKPIALHAALMFICWMPYLIILFPALMNWDTYYQITQCYLGDYPVWIIPWEATGSLTDAWFSDHHPLFDTLLYGLAARLSDHFTGSWNAGLFAFVVLQALASAAILTSCVAYLQKLEVPRDFQRLAYLFFCLAPFIPIFAATLVKDTLFSPLFVLYFLMVVECARTKGESLRTSKRSIALFVALGILLALTKKPGMHIVIGSACVLAIVYRTCWKAYVAQLAGVILTMSFLLPNIVFPLMHVVPGGTQETLGPLFQQTARYCTMYPEEMTDAERTSIDTVMGLEDLTARYNPTNGDPVKFGYRYDSCTSSDILSYLATWTSQGLRHPDAYIQATLATAAPYVNMTEPVTIIDYVADAQHGGSDLVHQPQAIEPLRNTLFSAYGSLCALPVAGVLFSAGLYVWLIPTVCLLALVMRKSRFTPALVPIGLSVLVCLVSPIFDGRYALPLILTAPLVIGMVLAPKQSG